LLLDGQKVTVHRHLDVRQDCHTQFFAVAACNTA